MSASEDFRSRRLTAPAAVAFFLDAGWRLEAVTRPTTPWRRLSRHQWWLSWDGETTAEGRRAIVEATKWRGRITPPATYGETLTDERCHALTARALVDLLYHRPPVRDAIRRDDVHASLGPACPAEPLDR